MNVLFATLFFQQDAPKQSPWGMLIMFGMIFVAMYFLMILPQKKERKRMQQMLENLKPGDNVLMQSGIYGTIVKIQDSKITLRVADGVKMDFLLSTVATVIAPEVKSE